MPKYPLKPLLEHRERIVDDATAELGHAVSAREVAEQACLRAAKVRREAEDQAARVRSDEAERLLRGELRAVDLARSDGWEHAAQAHIGHLKHAVELAEKTVGSFAAAEHAARGELARKMAERDVVSKDETRFERAQRTHALVAEEEAANEAFGVRRRT
jgi:hypothetical protein